MKERLSKMVPTIVLREETSVRDLGARIQSALDEFDALEPTKYALAHWLTNAYRGALALGEQEHWPVVIRSTAWDVKIDIIEAQAALARARAAASAVDGEFIASLPPRVDVARVKDASGANGFAPIDVRGAPLSERVLSLLLADYLTRPEAYVGKGRAMRACAETLPEIQEDEKSASTA